MSVYPQQGFRSVDNGECISERVHPKGSRYFQIYVHCDWFSFDQEFQPSKPASNSTKHLPIWGDPPSPVQVHKTVRRRNLQSVHRSLAITGEPPSTGAGLDIGDDLMTNPEVIVSTNGSRDLPARMQHHWPLSTLWLLSGAISSADAAGTDEVSVE